MTTLERPKLRQLRGEPIRHRGDLFMALEDPVGLCQGRVLIPLVGFQHVVRRFDGTLTLGEIQEAILRETGELLPSGDLANWVRTLDEALLLDGPHFASAVQQYRSDPIHHSVLAGQSYPDDPAELREQLDGFFRSPKGAGDPDRAGAPTGKLRGVLCPHIDFNRGGHVYSHAHRELIEHSDADTFVILGVSHNHPCRHRFAATRKGFETPLGIAQADQEFLDRMEESFGARLFEDELAHRPEWSIEFQVIFLQHLLGARRDFRIVPILTSWFGDFMEAGVDPIEDEDVAAMVSALKEAEAKSGRKVAYIGSVDFGHIGPEFDDPEPVDDPTLEQLRAFDSAMIGHASGGNPKGWFAESAAVNDRWRTCGLAATYTMLHAMGPAPGRLLSYDQAVNSSRTCCVSFASVAFDRA